MQIGLAKHVVYRMSPRLLATSLSLSAVSFVVYALFFDILAPSIPEGSVRSNSGAFFVLPVFLLLSGQTLVTTWLTHVSIAMVVPEKRDALKAYFVASVQILLYSGFYLMFPQYGPYTFIVYFMPNQTFPTASIPVLVAWSITIILGTFLLVRRVFGLNDGRAGWAKWLLLAATELAIIMVMAD